MLYIIITSYKEPQSTTKAINSFLNQDIKEKYKIIISDPFPEIEKILKKQFSSEFKSGKLKFFLDPGEGKGYALNVILEQIYSNNPEDIIILTDGDVHVSKNSVSVILDAFKDKKVGAITGRPVPLNSRKDFFGYIAHLAFDGIHNVRLKLSEQKKFFECSGYLFAIRNGVLQGFPTDTAEDSVIPFLMWKKGYKIKYVTEAKVFVISPKNWKDYKSQKIRNIKAHENINNLAPDLLRTKSLFNEVKYGSLFALQYPKSPLEFLYTLLAFPLRLYIYFKAFYGLKKNKFEDGWRFEEIKSTKPLD